jgi:hypothetical protein
MCLDKIGNHVTRFVLDEFPEVKEIYWDGKRRLVEVGGAERCLYT